uniref:Uncharacterized protein n=1 Tax=Solanum tuberosum TaxID=4113 RepID=M1DZ48_SOLTU
MEPPKEKPSWLGMLRANETFEPNPEILQEQWIHPNNQVKRKWYVSSYTLKQRESFRDLWIKDMRRIGCEIEFFKWFEMTGRIENCTESLQVIINKWYTTSNRVFESVTPPLEGINIPIAGTVIKASPFKEKSDNTSGILTSADIDRVIEQNNYSNQILHIISRQIEDTKPGLSGRPTPVSTSPSHSIETYPGFKIPEFSKEKFPKLSDTFEVTGNIIEKINAQLNNFNISVKGDKTSKKVSTLQEKSNLLQKLASSRFHNMKNYHSKPSFPDLQAIEFSSKFPNEIPDKTQLQRFLGSLNYVADFIPKVRKTCEPLYKRLRKNPIPWGDEQTQAVIKVKTLVQTIPCLGIPNPDAYMIVETDASDAGYGGILKQKIDLESMEQENMRQFRPNTPSKEGNDLPRAKMAKPFISSPLTPAKIEPSVRPGLTFQNKFTILADFPRLPSPTQTKLPKLICPPQPNMVNLRPTKPTIQEASSSSFQTKASYAMKTPESFAQVVNPELTKTFPSKPTPKEETFEFIISQVLPLMALNKEYGNVDTGTLIKPCYTDFNFVDTDNPSKTRRFYEAFLIDTDSIEIEHSRDANNYIQYSRFTIKKILDPFEWFADHLHTPIALTMTHRPQTYNWYDYKAAWMNFLYLRPRHTWFVKYSSNITKTTIPRWFYEWWNLFGGVEKILPQQFLNRFEEFQTKEEITTLPDHIKLCKYFIQN